uniref:Uncharacterized protein n=2 Tax=Dicentrarchus labrax TaxID=13489 RepID=A0A8P4G1F2_DICLA
MFLWTPKPQQDDTDFNPIGNRRKLGSSRRNKGRQRAKESVAESYHRPTEEVVGNTRDNEDLETTQMFVAIERTTQEKLSQGSEHDVITSAEHDSSLYSAIMPGYSSEVQNPTTTSYSESNLESLIPKSENLQEDHDESETDFKVEESDKSVRATLEGMDKSDTLQIQDVRGAHHLGDDVNKVHEQELKLTHDIDQSSESATHDATENSEIISGNLIDQAELIVKSTNDSAAKQEDSNPDDKQEKHPTKENNFEPVEQTNEDYHVYDTEKLQISDIEIGDTAVGQVCEIEGQEEHDAKSSAEQTVHQEKEGLLSEIEESDSSLQTPQSEIHVPLDSQTQQDDTDFNPIGNRRKLGSSRRKEGRQKVKESVAESYHEHKEEVVELTRGNEDLDTTQMLVAIERTSQEKLSQGSEHNVITSAEHDSSLYSAIMPGYSSEVQNPNTTSYSESNLESLIPKNENLQEDPDERETDFKVEESDKSVGATLEGMDKSDTLQIQDVRGAHHSEDDVNKVHEQELKLTHEIDQSSESATHDATENSEIISGNLIDQAELIVKSTNDSAAKQEDSNPDDKQEKHPTKENNFEPVEQTNEDYHVYDTEKLQISDIEIGDTAVGQVYEIEGQVEHDVKPSAEQTVHQEKEGLLSEMEESDSSLQTLQSEIHVPLDSQPRQDDTDFNPIGNRRKLGSSRRNKGRQRAKESVAESYHRPTEEVVGNTRDNEDLETTQMFVAIERTTQEKLSQGSEHDVITSAEHDSSLYSAIMPGYSSEVQNPTTTSYSESNLESLIPKSENLQEDHDESETDFKVEESDKSVRATLEGMDKSDTLQIQDVRGAHHLGDDVNKVHEQELKLTHDIDQSSESATHDATENSEIISGNLIDQAELIVKSTNDSAAKQEDSNPDDKQEKHPTKENNFEPVEQTNEDYHVYDTEKLQISDIEIGDTAVGQVCEIEGQEEHDAKSSAEQTVHQEKEGLLSEIEESDSSLQTPQSEIHVPLDSQTQQDDTDFNPIGNRRKLGSSRRNKGRQRAKESVAESYHRPTEEVVGNTRDNEDLETSKMALTIETAVLEKSLEGVDTFDTAQTEEVSGHVGTLTGISELTSSYLNSSSTGDQQLIDQSKSMEMPEEELPTVDSVTEKESKEKDKETEFLRQDGNLQVNYLVSESHLKSDDIVYTEIEHSIEQTVISSSNEEQIEHVNVCHVRGALHSQDVVNEVHEETVTTTQIQELHQIDFSSVKESECSSQTLQSETNAPLVSNPLDNSVRMEEKTHTGLNPIGNRRKLGSSRRNKGRQQVKEHIAESYHEQKKEAIEGNVGDETLETTKMSLATTTTWHEELKEETDQDLKPAPVRKIRSLINEENTEKMPEEATVLSQNVMDNSTIVTTDITSSSGKKGSVKSKEGIYEEEKNLIKQPENLSQFTGYDTVKTDLIQSPEDDSDIQNISYHDDNVTRSITSDVLEQEGAYQAQKTEALSCDKDSLGQESNMQQTHGTIGTVGDVTIKDYTEAESLMDVKLSGQEVGEEFEDPTKKDHEVQEMNASQEITHPELLSAAYNKNTVALIDIGLKENVKADAGKSNQKRRKMGSTRRTQLHKKPEEGMDNKDETKESDFNIEAEMKILDKMEVVPEILMIVTTEESQNENAKPSLSPVYKQQQETTETGAVHKNSRSSISDLQRIQSDVISDIDELKAPTPGQSASHNEEVVNPVVQVADINNTNTGISGVSFVSLSETTQGTQNDEERPVNIVDLETVKSVVRGGGAEEHKSAQAEIQEPNSVNEGAPNINLDMKNASPNLNSSSRRRKMGSTRKNLGSQSKREDLNQKQEVDNEATETATNVGGIKQELQLYIEDKDSDSEQRKEKVFETVEYSQTGESHFKPPSHQTFEENPVSHGQLVETEHQLTPNYPPIMPSTSPKHDIMSESASGGRRRKMGSHRKSHGHQNNENQTGRGERLPNTQNGRDESVIKTTEEESFGLDKITEVDESDKKASSNITSKAGEHSRPVSGKTPERVNPVRHPNTEIHLSQESQKTVSLDTSRGADLRSNRYNVVMVGDSSVGKTSFMKRAQSGKFSLDLPASVGLDSCVWTVLVDGKPVVLQLWDTAGQERFHSLTRQILHKAQAFLLMYDITSSQSFSAVSYWATCIQEGAAENTTILLLGNKSDHAERRVQTKEAEILAKEYNFEFMECSAATGENVVQSLETVARMLSQNADTTEKTTVLHREPTQKKSSGCC